jgi:hypothetical protein
MARTGDATTRLGWFHRLRDARGTARQARAMHQRAVRTGEVPKWS